MIRLKIRQDFEKNRDITDLSIINMLLHKNQQEFQETMNCWKQEVGTPVSAWRRACLLTSATPHALVQELRRSHTAPNIPRQVLRREGRPETGRIVLDPGPAPSHITEEDALYWDYGYNNRLLQ